MKCALEHESPRKLLGYAVAESFFGSLKKERLRRKVYKNRAEARVDVFDYIEVFYNQKRRHSHIRGVSPAAFESAATKTN